MAQVMATKGWGRALAGLFMTAVLAGCGQDDARRGPKVNPGGVSAALGTAPNTSIALDVVRKSDRVATAPDVLDGWQQMHRESVRTLVRQLSARGDAESLLDAALLSPLACYGTEDCAAVMAERARLLDRAARLAPDDPLIAFLMADACTTMGDCPAAYRRLATQDPDNLHAYLGLLHETVLAGDPAQVDRTLQAAAAASSYDPYTAALIAELESILQRLPAPSTAVMAEMAEVGGIGGPIDAAGARLMHAMGVSMGVTIPPLQSLLQTCGVDGVRQVPTRRAPCMAIFARMAGAGTVLARSVGLTRMVALTVGTAEAAHWRERLREFAWVQERFLQLPVQKLGIADLRLQVEQGEWAMMHALLLRHGIALQPPTDWVPGDVRYRQWFPGPG